MCQSGANLPRHRPVMTNPLQEFLSTRDWLLADGATGTNLFNMGLESGDAPEFWNETQPDKIRRLYSGAVDAGSDLFLTNTFGANASRLSCTMRVTARESCRGSGRKSPARSPTPP